MVCDVADCRTLPTGNGAVDVVVDKGTLDALHGDEDKLACMRECQRVLHPRGVLISISFGAARRMAFLQQSAGMLGLELHMHVVGDGDPASGHQARPPRIQCGALLSPPHSQHSPEELACLIPLSSLLDTEAVSCAYLAGCFCCDACGGPLRLWCALRGYAALLSDSCA